MISVVTCSIDERKFVGMKQLYDNALRGEEYDLVRIDDASSLAEGYLRGIDRAKGDVVVFSHDDAGPLRDGFGPRLRRHLSTYDVVGGAGTKRLDGPMWFTAGPPYVAGQVLNVMPPQPSLGINMAWNGTALVISKVAPDSALAKGDVRVNDVLAGVNGSTITQPQEVTPFINQALTNPDKKLTLNVIRDLHPKKCYVDFAAGLPMEQKFNLSAFGVSAPITGGIQAIDGFFMAARRDVLVNRPFDPEVCDGFHMYDIDFSWRMYRRGHTLAVANDLCLGHASSGGYGDPKWKAAADKWLAVHGKDLAPHVHRQYALTSIFLNSLQEGIWMQNELVEQTRRE